MSKRIKLIIILCSVLLLSLLGIYFAKVSMIKGSLPKLLTEKTITVKNEFFGEITIKTYNGFHVKKYVRRYPKNKMEFTVYKNSERIGALEIIHYDLNSKDFNDDFLTGFKHAGYQDIEIKEFKDKKIIECTNMNNNGKYEKMYWILKDVSHGTLTSTVLLKEKKYVDAIDENIRIELKEK